MRSRWLRAQTTGVVPAPAWGPRKWRQPMSNMPDSHEANSQSSPQSFSVGPCDSENKVIGSNGSVYIHVFYVRHSPPADAWIASAWIRSRNWCLLLDIFYMSIPPGLSSSARWFSVSSRRPSNWCRLQLGRQQRHVRILRIRRPHGEPLSLLIKERGFSVNAISFQSTLWCINSNSNPWSIIIGEQRSLSYTLPTIFTIWSQQKWAFRTRTPGCLIKTACWEKVIQKIHWCQTCWWWGCWPCFRKDRLNVWSSA